jgi:hypothetical protein
VTWNAAPIVIESAAVAVWGVGDVVSVAFRVKVIVPGALGVPEMLFPESVRPIGREPETIDQL